MSTKNKPDPIATQSYQSSLAQANAPNKHADVLHQQAMNVIDAANSGDYTKRPKSIFFNMADPAQRQRQRSMISGAKGQGVAGLGGADPNLIALNKENVAAHQAEDDAGQYEQDWKEATGAAGAQEGDLAALEQSRRLGVLGSGTSLYGTALANRTTPLWVQLMNSAARGAGSAATMGA